jgi:ribosomal-protein-alanine N-acetyltransferase
MVLNPSFTELAPQFSPMTQADVDLVMELEVRCFSSPWSASTYRHELRMPRASYWVVRPGDHLPATVVPPILGYGGLWLLGDEAHITTIAVHPEWQRRHLGEWLLLRLIGVAHARAVQLVTLEVRVQNAPAIALYTKLRFEDVGIRKGYYQDTGEDARLLTLFGLQRPEVWHRLEARRQAIETGAGPDAYAPKHAP